MKEKQQKDKQKIDKNKKVIQIIPTDLALTEKALQWIVTYGEPLCCTDFLGYVARMHPIKPVYIACDLWSNFLFFSKQKVNKKSIKEKWLTKWFDALVMDEFLEISVFEEFKPRYRLPIDPNKTFFSDEFMFEWSYKGFEL